MGYITKKEASGYMYCDRKVCSIDMYLLLGIPLGIITAPHFLVQVYHTCLTNGVQFTFAAAALQVLPNIHSQLFF